MMPRIDTASPPQMSTCMVARQHSPMGCPGLCESHNPTNPGASATKPPTLTVPSMTLVSPRSDTKNAHTITLETMPAAAAFMVSLGFEVAATAASTGASMGTTMIGYTQITTTLIPTRAAAPHAPEPKSLRTLAGTVGPKCRYAMVAKVA
eukprot:6313759-Prymnesium_polylepis.1